MSYLLNVLYLIALLTASPVFAYRYFRSGKYRRGLWRKLSGTVSCPVPLAGQRVAWFHGVSVGEIHLLRPIVARFRERFPEWTCVISTTTDTGYDEARKHFGDETVFFWPLDFSWAVRRALNRVQPSLVVLAEGEVWPNFLAAARVRGVPVAVVNARLSPRSFRRYQLLGTLACRLYRQLDLVLAQTDAYADCYRELGVEPSRLQVTGSVKYDGVQTDRHNPRTEALRILFGVGAGDIVWVAGSTQAPEEALVLEIFQRMRPGFPKLRLFLVPRQKDRFDEVARLLDHSRCNYRRRSQLTEPIDVTDAVVLVDTIGELGALWGLAAIAYVGGSMDGRRGGQNMLEPAAFGATVLFGPHVWNFQESAERLVRADAAIQVRDAASLETSIRALLSDAGRREGLGNAARSLVRSQQGATARTIDALGRLIDTDAGWRAA